jgi:hypothetical protein
LDSWRVFVRREHDLDVSARVGNAPQPRDIGDPAEDDQAADAVPRGTNPRRRVRKRDERAAGHVDLEDLAAGEKSEISAVRRPA